MSLRKNVKKTAKNVAGGAIGAASFISSVAADTGKKVTKAASEGAGVLANAVQKTQQEMRFEKYNPVFPDEYSAPDYDLPNLIVIADGDPRKEIDICEGAIGWLDKSTGMEVLFLYEEYVPFSGLNFSPYPMLNAAYYVNPLDNPLNKKRYINLNSFCEIIQKEKITELRNIAHALGAKECLLESYEEEKTNSRSKLSGTTKARIVKASANLVETYEASQSHSLVFSQEFEGSDHPTEPELNWFKDDNEFKSLIKMRCTENNKIQKYSIKIDAKSFSSLSTEVAASIDAALKSAKASVSSSMKKTAEKEAKRSLVFKIIF